MLFNIFHTLTHLPTDQVSIDETEDIYFLFLNLLTLKERFRDDKVSLRRQIHVKLHICPDSARLNRSRSLAVSSCCENWPWKMFSKRLQRCNVLESSIIFRQDSV